MDENTCREFLTAGEVVELGRRIEELERPAAKERQASTLKQNADDRSGNLPERDKGQTRDKVAAALGVSGRTYEKAKAVVTAAEAEPDLSNRAIAEKVKERTGEKVDHKTVGKVRGQLGSLDEIPQFPRTTGRDGKSRPARPEPASPVTIDEPDERATGDEHELTLWPVPERRASRGRTTPGHAPGL